MAAVGENLIPHNNVTPWGYSENNRIISPGEIIWGGGLVDYFPKLFWETGIRMK